MHVCICIYYVVYVYICVYKHIFEKEGEREREREREPLLICTSTHHVKIQTFQGLGPFSQIGLATTRLPANPHSRKRNVTRSYAEQQRVGAAVGAAR